ncbi:unnamed protein product [Penicillium salamii]|nr:unnamed protein product [Penicillium salamii]
MKGFIGGIPIALLAVAAQAQFVERQGQGIADTGNTVINGPSGKDADATFTNPYAPNIHENHQKHTSTKEDHSVNVKHTTEFYPEHHGPVVVEGPQVPGMGPFSKRHTPGGTALGGPSGNDGGQSFDMPTTVNVNTAVDENNQDDHSIGLNHKDSYYALPPWKRSFGHGHEGGTALGGPSGDDEGSSFSKSNTANIHTNVNEVNKDDHSIDLDHKDSYYGLPPWKRGLGHDHEGGTALGGPSGTDGGQSFDLSNTANIKTDVNEHNQDDHSIGLDHKDSYYGLPPWKRSFGHGHEGGTALGGPSGDDEGQSVSLPTTVDVNTAVNEHNQDDHSIDLKHKDAYYGLPPWKRSFGHDNGGGTALGGPSGDDEGQSVSLPTTVDVTTSVHDVNKDDHSIGLDHTDSYGLPPWKRGLGPEHGGTALGGPSGDDGGQSFDLSNTANIKTDVNDVNKDSHAIDLKHTDINGPGGPGPWGPHHGGWGPHHDVDLNSIKQENNGPAAGGVGPFNRRSTEHWPHPHPGYWGPEEDFDLNAIKQVNNGPAAGGVGPFNRRSTEHWPHPHPGYWAPEEDFDINTINQVNNGPSAGGVGGFARRSTEGWEHPHPHPHPGYWAPEVDHDINTINQVNNGPAAGGVGPFNRRSTENWPHPHPHPYWAPEEDFDINSIKQINNGPAAGGVGPFNRRSTEGWEHPHPHPHPGYWAPEEDFDLNAIKQVNNGPSAGAVGPFGRRAFAPTRESTGGDGTALGGPSNDDDDGTAYSDPTNVDSNTDVDEHSEDNHAVKEDVTHIHHPDGPYGASPSHEEAPPSPPSEDHSEGPPASFSSKESAPPREENGECSAQVHEVVRTVTKTQYKTAMATRVLYQSAPSMETSAVPMANTPQQSAQVDPKIMTSAVPMANTAQQSAQVDPKMMSYAVSAPVPASSDALDRGYDYASQRPNSHAASYSMIPVHVPMASPASSGTSMATPSGTHGLNMPTGVDAEKKAAASSSAAASPSNSHGANTVFMGAAPRLSGGLVSAATAVMGVLAFIL